ncbi:MAG: hypothetical protein B6U68_03730, partial [Candidatus Aenigmarchaeota archaeon ex4484_14]
DGTFRPNDPITRAEAIVFLARAYELPSSDSGQQFSDVTPDHFAYDEINAAAECGLIGGYGDGTFRPDENLIRRHGAVIIYRAMEENTCESDLCENISCEDYCDEDTLYYDGYCSEGSCKYESRLCEFGCENAECISDPCQNLECDNYCENYTLYYDGICVDGKCEYESKICEHGCENGVCIGNCEGVVCEDYCSGDKLYHNGHCINGQCEYDIKVCEHGCLDGACKEQEQYFSDVPSSHYDFEKIQWLYEQGVVSGYSDGTFKPDNIITRAQASKIIVKAAGWKTTDDCDYICTLHNKGVITTTDPQYQETRRTFSVMIARAKGFDLPTEYEEIFSDVSESDWSWKYIYALYANGVVYGYPDATFRPNEKATRAVACRILYRAMNDGTGWIN